MAANTPRNNQITCIDDIATHDLFDMICWMGVLVGLAPKLVHHTMKAVFFLQIRQNHCMWGKIDVATIIDFIKSLEWYYYLL